VGDSPTATPCPEGAGGGPIFSFGGRGAVADLANIMVLRGTAEVSPCPRGYAGGLREGAGAVLSNYDW
jgi:hypothetical protein